MKPPWTNGQVERLESTIKEATVKRVHYNDAYNFGRRRKTLKSLTPYEFICKRWTLEPEDSS
ncbi:integrase (plasmid) [Agrobacterium vitis]|nr:integrase [Agrobacterium vitis]